IIDTPATHSDWKLETGDLWFRMGWNNDGPFRYDGDKLYALKFPPIPRADSFYMKFPNASWSPYDLYSLYRDHHGHIWFGTSALGVCRYDGNSLAWFYQADLSKANNGGDFGFRSMIEDDKGNYWINNSRYQFRFKSGYKEDNGEHKLIYEKEEGVGFKKEDNKLFFPFFMSMVQDDKGFIWGASYNDGVWCFDGNSLKHYPVRINGKMVDLFSMYKDNHGVIWVVSHKEGLFRLKGNDFIKFGS
ncbi:MAG: hypothetical protein KJO50_06665, partial [Bacteroidia bacterium]|nr:hypothetical protein [Bacteroidia bacterium]